MGNDVAITVQVVVDVCAFATGFVVTSGECYGAGVAHVPNGIATVSSWQYQTGASAGESEQQGWRFGAGADRRRWIASGQMCRAKGVGYKRSSNCPHIGSPTSRHLHHSNARCIPDVVWYIHDRHMFTIRVGVRLCGVGYANKRAAETARGGIWNYSPGLGLSTLWDCAISKPG